MSPFPWIFEDFGRMRCFSEKGAAPPKHVRSLGSQSMDEERNQLDTNKYCSSSSTRSQKNVVKVSLADGLQPSSDGLQPSNNGLQPKSDGLQATNEKERCLCCLHIRLDRLLRDFAAGPGEGFTADLGLPDLIRFHSQGHHGKS